jgi:serine/threonine protein phosphatase PrpC
LETCFRTEKGLRPQNEDSCGVWKFSHAGLTLLAVADGLGGHPAGEIASAAAVEELSLTIERRLDRASNSDPEELYNALSEGFSRADNEVFSRGARVPAWRGMGTTLVAALIDDKGRGIIGNLGDSRAYAVGSQGVVRLTVDHSRVMELVARGMLAPEEADRHPMKNIVTHIVGRPGDIPDFYPVQMENGVLILCSDGLNDGLREKEIERIALTTPFPRLCRALVDEALRESRDNVTVVAAKRVVVQGKNQRIIFSNQGPR